MLIVVMRTVIGLMVDDAGGCDVDSRDADGHRTDSRGDVDSRRYAEGEGERSGWPPRKYLRGTPCGTWDGHFGGAEAGPRPMVQVFNILKNVDIVGHTSASSANS